MIPTSSGSTVQSISGASLPGKFPNGFTGKTPWRKVWLDNSCLHQHDAIFRV